MRFQPPQKIQVIWSKALNTREVFLHQDHSDLRVSLFRTSLKVRSGSWVSPYLESPAIWCPLWPWKVSKAHLGWTVAFSLTQAFREDRTLIAGITFVGVFFIFKKNGLEISPELFDAFQNIVRYFIQIFNNCSHN